MKRISIFTVFLFAMTQVIGCSQVEDNSSQHKFNNQTDTLYQFESELESIRQIAMIPGMSAAIVKDQQPIWAQGIGYADLDEQIPASQDIPIFLASKTKPFAAILLIVTKGRLGHSNEEKTTPLTPWRNTDISKSRT